MGSAARKKDESPPSYIIHWMLLEGIVGAEAEKEESEMAFVVGQGVISLLGRCRRLEGFRTGGDKSQIDVTGLEHQGGT